MMHARGRQQAGERRARAIGVAIGEDEDRVAGIDAPAARLFRSSSACSSPDPPVEVEQHRNPRRAETGVVDVAQPRHLIVVDDRVLDLICRHDSGRGSSRLPSGPMVDSIEVTSCSRIASSGGLVTCANTCLK